MQDNDRKESRKVSNQSRYKRFQRPETLFGLFAPMVALPGVGDKLASVLKKGRQLRDRFAAAFARRRH